MLPPVRTASAAFSRRQQVDVGHRVLIFFVEREGLLEVIDAAIDDLGVFCRSAHCTFLSLSGPGSSGFSFSSTRAVLIGTKRLGVVDNAQIVVGFRRLSGRPRSGADSIYALLPAPPAFCSGVPAVAELYAMVAMEASAREFFGSLLGRSGTPAAPCRSSSCCPANPRRAPTESCTTWPGITERFDWSDRAGPLP